MDKKIIHMKIPMMENAKYSNMFAVDHEMISKFASLIRNQLGDEYTFIVSPMDVSCIDGDVKIVNIDAKEYSHNELMKIIEKANMYDDLCE